MNRILLATIFLFVGAYHMASMSAPAQQPIPVPPIPGPGNVDPRMSLFTTCAKHCDDCARSCELAANHCVRLLADGKKDALATMRMCQDCAAICAATSRIVMRDGPLAPLICPACADACKQCADACEKIAGDPIGKRCVEDCRACEKACREMSKVVRVEQKESK